MTVEGYIAIAVIILMIVALIKEMMRPGLVLFTALVVFMALISLLLKRPWQGSQIKG